jgi:hypothetical protein
MQPEPSHRTVKKRKRAPNERPPICFRPGDLRAELDARCDGTEAGYRATVVRDLARYWEMLDLYSRSTKEAYPGSAREDYEDWLKGEAVTSNWATPEELSYIDALERAHILVTNAGLTVDHALVVVGLVKEEEG